MTVKDIVEKYLRENGYGGLFEEYGECGCELGDLAPCGDMNEKCQAGYKVNCTVECEHEDICDWHIQRDKPKEEGK